VVFIRSGIGLAIRGQDFSWPRWVALVPLTPGVLLLLLLWIRVKSSSYRLTTQRLFVRRGWLAKHVNELELYRVKDVVVGQAGLQRLLRYGTITVLAADDTTPGSGPGRSLEPDKSQRDDQNPVPRRPPARRGASHRVHEITLNPTHHAPTWEIYEAPRPPACPFCQAGWARRLAGFGRYSVAVKKVFLRIDGAQWAERLLSIAFFSLFPLTVLLVTVASCFVDRDRAAKEVIAYMESYVPISGEMQHQVF